MNRSRHKPYWLLPGLLLTLAGVAYAAGIEATPRKDYGRINFAFDAPTSMRASSSGTTATLTFETPLKTSPDAIKAGLPDYVTGTSLSADQKTLTLRLSKPYRIRQFTSGNVVGLDLIARTDTKPDPKQFAKAQAEPAPSDETMLTTKKPKVKTPEKAKPKPEKKDTTAKVAKPDLPKETLKTDAPMLSTKTVVEVAKPEPKQETGSEAVLTTKHEEPAKPVEVLTTPAAVPETAPVEAAEEKPEPVAETAVEKPVAVPAKDTAPFVVTTKTDHGETTIHFPWKERTGAAVFKRGRDLWVVFSRYRDVGAPLLATTLPKNVVGVTQYAYPKNTVLRMVTDGSLNARAAQASDGFGWNITLGSAAPSPPLHVSLSSDTLEGTPRLVLGVFDVAEPVKFYDPSVGDQLIVVPANESGRGVANTRNFPTFSVLASSQGVALVNRADALDLSQTRTGLIVHAPGGLAVSGDLPVLSGKNPIAGASASSGVMLPYDQWFVPPEKFRDALAERLIAVTNANKATRAEALFEVVKLYLGHGLGLEALGNLAQIRDAFPEYYTTHKLALLTAVSHALMNHMDLAAQALDAPELADSEEAALWRQLVALSMPPVSDAQKVQQAVIGGVSDSSANDPNAKLPTAEEIGAAHAKPGIQFMKYSRPFIRFYPPRIRQMLATAAADAYLASGQEEKALAVYDTLMRDGILDPVKLEAEFALGMVAKKKEEADQALDIFDRIAKQLADRRTAARAAAEAAALRYRKGKLSADDAAEAIEQARMRWRGDDVERVMLRQLAQIYTDAKRYNDVLRTYKTTLDVYPNDPEYLTLSGNLGELFRRMFLEGLADDMDPLKALAVFYEFRDLTPLGEDGDLMIQRLADRLAAIDLLDRATQLLDSQIKFRSSGESRSRIGARLALLQLFNQHPKEALNTLEVTNYGGNKPELQTLRLQLTAQALMKLGKNEEALGVIYNDRTPEGAQLRLDILWAMKDWPNIVNRAEEVLSVRPNLTDPLTPKETEALLKLALAYTFESDYTQLRYLRDYYSGLIPDTAYKQVFDYITNDTTPLDSDDFNLVAQQISRTEGFLGLFKEKIAAGKLSEAVK